MAFYTDSETIYSVLEDLFSSVQIKEPDAFKGLVVKKMVVRLQINSPTSEITFDGRHRPLEMHFGNFDGHSSVDIILNSEVLHEILLDKINPGGAYKDGHIKVKGSPLKLLSMLEVFNACKKYYPQILEEHSLV